MYNFKAQLHTNFEPFCPVDIVLFYCILLFYMLLILSVSTNKYIYKS